MKKFTLLIASLFMTIGAMAQNTLVLGVNSIPETKVDLANGLESGYYLLKQVNSSASAAGGQGVGWIKAASEASNAVVTSKNTGTPGADGVTYVWYVEVVDAGNNLITISTANKVAAWQAPDKYQKDLVAYGSRATLKYHTGTVNISGNATPNDGSCFISNEGVTAFVHFSGDNLGSWTDTNSASMFMVEFYKLESANLNAIVTEELSYTLTDAAGNEFTGTYEGAAGTTVPSFTGATGFTLSDGTWNGTKYTATINFAYPVSKVGGATNEVLLDINSTGKYIRNDGDNVKVSNATADASCLWAIYPSLSEGTFTFAIMNVATGKYIYTESTAAAHDTEGTIVLNDTPTQFAIASDKDFKVSDKNLFLSINSPVNDNGVYLGVYGNAHNGTNINSTTVPAYPITITDAKYATFYAPYAVTVPDGVTAHTVTLNGEWATLSDPIATIPAYTGVVLYSETAATYQFTVTEDVDAIENNALRGTVAATNISDDAYVLANGANGVGFYIATKNQEENAKWLNNHHKAYLPKPAGSESVACYSFRFGEGTTGVEKVEMRTENGEIFDLTGRKVNSIAAPGIYIVNGKKVLVK